MNSRRVTIKEVASASGVTPQTVSRVFRGQGYVSSETRRRVFEVAEQLKYVPNTAAIRLRTGEAKSIAVVFDSLINVYFSIMVEYLQHEFQKYGYDIQTIFAHSHEMEKSIYVKALSMGVSAVISFLEPAECLAQAVADYAVPVMVVGRRTDYETIDYITTDDVLGGELAAKQFVACGCKTCVYMAYGFGMTCVKDRYDGFRRELEKHGMQAGIIDCAEGVEVSIKRYVAENGAPDGLFCFSDILAFEALKVTEKTGRKIKIIGYDNIQADIPMPIELTSVGVEKHTYVKQIADSLLQKIEGKYKGRIGKSVEVKLHDGTTAR